MWGTFISKPNTTPRRRQTTAVPLILGNRLYTRGFFPSEAASSTPLTQIFWRYMWTPLTVMSLSFASVPVPRTNRTPSRLLGQLGAAHGDMAEPEQIVEYASEQLARLSDALAAAIMDRPQA